MDIPLSANYNPRRTSHRKLDWNTRTYESLFAQRAPGILGHDKDTHNQRVETSFCRDGVVLGMGSFSSE
jgi:hypothetical protein